MKECKRCGLKTGFPGIIFGNEQCNYCDIHDSIEQESDRFDFSKYVKNLQEKDLNYHCLIGISGGLDSSILLWWTVRYLRLNPLVIHFDNGYNSDEAEHNMKMLIRELNVTMIRYTLPIKTFEQNCIDILRANVTDCDITNDLAMAKLMLETADQYNIKVIFNGHDFRREGTCPVDWTYMDARYYQSMVSNPLLKALTIWDQIWYSIKGIKHIRPLYFLNQVTRKKITDDLDSNGFLYYPAKHAENDYTSFIGYRYLPEKFGIDKTMIYKAAHKRSGLKYTALPFVYDTLNKVEFILPHYHHVVKHGFDHNRRDQYPRYDFRRWKLIFWILTRLRFFPKTFYIKYCQ